MLFLDCFGNSEEIFVCFVPFSLVYLHMTAVPHH